MIHNFFTSCHYDWSRKKEESNMDTFDNNEIHSEAEDVQPQPLPGEAPQPQYTPQPESGAYQGAGAGRRESPYANSPYVMDPPQGRQEYRYQPQTQPPRPPKQKKSRKPIWQGIVAALLTLALVAGGCLITASSVNAYWEARTEDTVNTLNQKIDALQKQLNRSGGTAAQPLPADGSTLTTSQIYARSVDSVVAISSTVQSSSFYGTTQGSTSGSGFILTEDGYIVTNYHVIQGALSISVILHDGTEYTAEELGHDETNDLAVLKVEATDLPAATLGSSADLSIGDMVVAIGNPLGKLTATQTVGYVSGINREVTTDNSIISMIQTDAAINPGNSGGPLFNMRGEVVGITTAKYSGTTNSGASIEGIGFAIPIDDVAPIIDDLMEYGYITGAYMGVEVTDTDESSARMFGLPTGAYITKVEPGGSADRAGLQVKDIVIDLGGVTISNHFDLIRALRAYKAGDSTTVTIIRAGKEQTLDITLDEKPQDTTAQPAPQPDADMPSEGDYDEWFDWFFGRSGR